MTLDLPPQHPSKGSFSDHLLVQVNELPFISRFVSLSANCSLLTLFYVNLARLYAGPEVIRFKSKLFSHMGER